jgi:hypothetical protein
MSISGWRPLFKRLNERDIHRVQSSMKTLVRIVPLPLSVGLLAGCAGGVVSTASTSSATDDSAHRSFHETMDRVNQQMALDSANAAAQQQFNDSMAATQLFENQHNDEFNQNSLH